MFFILGGVVYGQSNGSDSEKVLKDFLYLAEQRNLNKAMTLVANQAKIYKNNPELAVSGGGDSENLENLIADKYTRITMNLWYISLDKIITTKITNNKISNNIEIFTINGIDRNREIRKAKAVLIKEENMWKVFSFAWENKLNIPQSIYRKIS